MKKTISAILSLALILSSAVFMASADTAVKASDILADYSCTTVISADDFNTLGSVSNKIASFSAAAPNMSAELVDVEEDAENFPFDKAISFSLETAADKWTDQKMTFTLSSGATASLITNLAVGDTGLLKFSAKRVEGTGNLAMTLWSSAVNKAGGDAQSGRRIDGVIPGSPTTEWRTYYFPFTACEMLNSLIVKLNGSTATTVLIADMEFVNFGTAVTEAELADALDAASDTAKLTTTGTSFGTFNCYVTPLDLGEEEEEEEENDPETFSDIAEYANLLINSGEFLTLGKVTNKIYSASANASYMNASAYSVPASDRTEFFTGLKLECHTPVPAGTSWTSQSLSYTLTGDGIVPDGHTGLLKFSAKSETQGISMAVTLWSSTLSKNNTETGLPLDPAGKQGRRIDGTISGNPEVGVWNDYYFPFTSCEKLNNFILKVYNKVGSEYLTGTIDFAEIELIDFGTDITEAQLAAVLENELEPTKLTFSGTGGTFYCYKAPTPLLPETEPVADESDFETFCDAGYYGEEGDPVSGAIAINSFFDKYDEDGLTGYGIYVYNAADDEKSAYVVSADVTGLSASEGRFYALVDGILPEYFSESIVAMPYVVFGEEVIFGDSVTYCVNDGGKWLGL